MKGWGGKQKGRKKSGLTAPNQTRATKALSAARKVPQLKAASKKVTDFDVGGALGTACIKLE